MRGSIAREEQYFILKNIHIPKTYTREEINMYTNRPRFALYILGDPSAYRIITYKSMRGFALLSCLLERGSSR